MKEKVKVSGLPGNRRNRLKGIATWSFLGLMGLTTRVSAQTVFTESIGSVSGTTTIAAHETANGFDNDGFTMTGTADIRNTTPSSGYTGASGAANVFITNTSGTNFQIAGINTTSFSGLTLSFGIFKSTVASNGSDLIVEISTDGVGYTPLTVPALPTGSGTADWILRTASGAIPSTANLRIRFRQNGSTTQYRIDDVKLVGTGCSPASINPSGTVAICQGSSRTLTASAGTSYLWSNGATTQNISVSTAGNYTVTVSGPGACVSTSPATTVTVNALPSAVVTAGGPTTFCNGGSVVLTAAETSATYSWSNGATTKSITVSNSGTFSVTVTKNGCSVTSTPVTVTERAVPVATITTNGSSVICPNGSTQLTANSAASYLWSDGETTQSIFPTTSGSYTVQVTDAFGCSSAPSAAAAVYVRSLPNVNAGTDVAICAGGSAALSATVKAADLFISEYVEGSGNNKYIELYNGTGAAINLADYRLRTYSNGNTVPNFENTLSGTLANGQTIVFKNASASAYTGAATAISSMVFNGNDAVTLFKISANSNIDIFGRIGDDPGTEWVSGSLSTEGRTLRRKTSIYEGVDVNPTQTGVGAFLTLGSDWDGFAEDNVSGLGAHTISGTYTWSPASGLNTTNGAAVVASPAVTTTYTVTGNFACSNSDAVVVTVNAKPAATTAVTNVNCNGGNNGAINLTVTAGQAPFTYSWSNGATTEDISGLTAGTYTVQVTSATGCTASFSATVAQPAALTASSSATAILCNGGTAEVTVSANGGTAPYTGVGTFTVTAGTYNYTVTDTNGCTAVTSITVAEPAVLTASASQDAAILCNGGSTTVTVAANGGTAPYTGVGTFTVTAGTYNYTVTDANGCTAATSITVTEPTALTVAASQVTAVLCNGGTATVTVAADGGTAPYTGAGTFTVTAGTYNYTVTDANGCTATTSIIVSEPPVLVASANIDSAITCNGGSATVTITAEGGTRNDGDRPYLGTGTFEVTAGTYNYTVTDANGCTSTVSVTVTEPIALSASAVQGAAILCNGGSTTVTVSANGGTAPYTGVGTFTVTAGTYNYTVTDANGCAPSSASVSITVAEPAALTASAVQNAAILCNGGSTTVTVAANGGTAPYTGAGTFTVTAGTYNYTVTDANGCTATTSITVAQPAALTASAVQGAAIACNGGSTTVTVSANGGTAPYTGAGTFTVTAGTYNYTVTDANGCTASTSITVAQPAVLNASSVVNGSIACFGGTTTVTVAANGGTAPYTGVGTFTVTAGSRTFTVTDAHGCTASTSVTVSQPATAVSASISPLALDRCGRDIQIFRGYGSQSVQLNGTATGGTPGYTYSWAPATGLNNSHIANPTASPTTTTTYTLTVTDSKGCTATAHVTVNVLDVRCGTLLGIQQVTICHEIVVIVGGLQVHTQEQLCVPTAVAATLLVTTNSCLGSCASRLEEQHTAIAKSSLTAYPNPATNVVNLDIRLTESAPVSIRITDMLGKLIAVQEFEGTEGRNNWEWNTNNMEGAPVVTGSYICHVTIGNTSETIRLNVQH